MIFVFLTLAIIRATWTIWGIPLSVPELKWLLIGERLGEGFVMYRDLYDHTGPLATFVYQVLDVPFGKSRWAHVFFSTVLITVQAGILNRILVKNKAYEENTYVPGFLYVIVMSGTMDFFALSPQLLSLTFLLLALGHILRRIDNVASDELFIRSGLYLALATCFYIPSGIFIFIFLLGFSLFTSAIVRRLAVMVINIFLVFGGIWIYFFLFEAEWDFVHDFFVTGVTKPTTFYIGPSGMLIASANLTLTGTVALSALFTVQTTVFQRKIQKMMLAFVIATFIVAFISVDLMMADLVFLGPPVTFFLTHYFLGLKRGFWKQSIPLLFISVLVLYPLALFKMNILDQMTVKEDQRGPISGERLMGIGVPISYYQNCQLAGPFLNNHVSRGKLRDINYYDTASEIYQGLVKSKPEVVIDHWGEAGNLFSRFPDFGRKYEKVSDGIYRLKTSN